jgi:uncharacterized membrane protein YdjX (TVP38/TMEM64 family)
MRIYFVVAAIVLAMVTPLFIFGDQIDDAFGGEAGLARLQSYGAWAWAVGIGLIVSDLILPVPSTAVIAGLAMIYGPVLGGLLGGIGSLLAGLVAYGGCRLLGPKAARFLLGDTSLGKLQQFFAVYGLWAIALSRWMPLLPEALCCLAGLARMRFLPFLAALACGSFIMGFVFAFLGQAYIDQPAVGLILSALIPLAIWPIVHRAFRTNEKKE